MAASDYLFAASGTACLEAALIGTPMFMAYSFSLLSWLISFAVFPGGAEEHMFAMPNILLGRRVLHEQLQFATDPVTLSLVALDDMRGRLGEMRREFAALEPLLGGPGASSRAAARVLGLAGA
jgi:lipid-A-disaccharide synthase